MDLMNLSGDAFFQERYQQSEELAEKAHVMIEHVLGPGHARSIYVDNALGSAQCRMGHYASAIETFNERWPRRDVCYRRRRACSVVVTWLGKVQFYVGDDEAAIAAFGEAMSISTEANDAGGKGMAEFVAGTAAIAVTSRRCCADA